MNIEQQIIKLIGELKKETDPEKKKKIKQKLKQLYKQLNRVRQNKTDKKLEFKLPIKQDVKDILSGQFEDINKIRNKLSAMKKGVDLTIKKLEERAAVLSGEEKQRALFEIEKQKIVSRLIGISMQRGDKVLTGNMQNLMTEIGELDFGNEEGLVELVLTFADDNQFTKENMEEIMGKLSNYSGYDFNTVFDEAFDREPDMFTHLFYEKNPITEVLKKSGLIEEKEEEEGDEEKEEGEFKQGEDLSFEEKRRRHKQNVADIQAAVSRMSKPEPQLELSSSRPLIPSEVPEIAAQIKGRKKGIASFGQMLNPLKWWGLGKRKKMKGGAGISDYLSVLGNMPGLSQMAGMVPIIGPMLGPAIGLAQTGSNIASQGMKEAGLGPGEQVKGLFGTIGKLFGMGKPNKMGLELLKAHSGGSLHLFYKKHQKKLNKHGIKGAGFLSDLMGTIGGITPHLSSVLGFIPGAGPILQMGNSAIGSATRVGEDILKKIGLGKKKRGGRKMLPNPFSMDGLYPENEMNDGMAYIQPYYGSGNLPNGGNVSEEYEDHLNQQIVQLLKNRYLDEIKNTDMFNAQLAAKTNTEQQSAVFQLLYAKLLKDASQEEERRRDAQLLQE
jgi:hypothetical protein